MIIVTTCFTLNMKHYTSKNFSDVLVTSNSEWKWKSDALEATKKTLNKPILIVL